METVPVEEFYKRKAKDLTNLLFNKGFLSEDLSREAIDWLEDYLGFVFQSECQMSARTALLIKEFKDKE